MVTPIKLKNLTKCPFQISTTSFNNNYPVFIGVEPVIFDIKDSNMSIKKSETSNSKSKSDLKFDSNNSNNSNYLSESLENLAERASQKIHIDDFIYLSDKSVDFKINDETQFFDENNNLISSSDLPPNNYKIHLVLQLKSLAVDYYCLKYWWNIQVLQVKILKRYKLPNICLLENVILEDDY